MILLRVRYTRHTAAQKKKLVNRRKKFRQETKKLIVPVLSKRKPEKNIIERVPFPLPLLGFPILCTRWNSMPFASSKPRLSVFYKINKNFFSCLQPKHSAGLRFQTIPVSFQITGFPGDCRFPDKWFVYGIHWYLFFSCPFSFIWEQSISNQETSAFFNGHDVGLYIGYFSLKTVHCLVKVVHFFIQLR